jgi:hypothetical protein
MSSRTDILFQDVASPWGIVTEIGLPGNPATRDAPIPITSAPSRSRLGREATEASYFGSNGFEVPALAVAVDAASPIRVDEDGTLYAYVDGYYAVDGVRRIGELATELLGRRFTRNHWRTEIGIGLAAARGAGELVACDTDDLARILAAALAGAAVLWSPEDGPLIDVIATTIDAVVAPFLVSPMA